MSEQQSAASDGNNEEGVLMKQLEREIFTAKAFYLLSLLGKSKKANNRSRLAKVETFIECTRWEQCDQERVSVECDEWCCWDVSVNISLGKSVKKIIWRPFRVWHDLLSYEWMQAFEGILFHKPENIMLWYVMLPDCDSSIEDFDYFFEERGVTVSMALNRRELCWSKNIFSTHCATSTNFKSWTQNRTFLKWDFHFEQKL